MKTWLIGALMVAVATALVPLDADAKRLGGGKSTGTQRSMPERTAPSSTTPPTQAPAAAPGQQAAAPAEKPSAPVAAPAPAAAPAAAAGKRSWLGPIAGLAAGLGLAALMSHLGLGEAFANFLMLALLVVAAIALVMFIRRRFAGAGAPRPALAGAAAGAGAGAQVAWPAAPGSEPATPLQRRLEPVIESPAAGTPGTAAAGAAPLAPAFVPAAFDSEGFERVAKAIFIRLQAANDAGNLDDLRQFTTPEMFAELKVDLLERGSAAQTTEVKSVEARVIDVAEEGERQVVSVRYRGEVVESPAAAPEKFDEVWHLVRPRGSEGGWAIAGIEQMPG